MSWIDGLRARVGFLLGRSKAERELAEELAFHLERETERNVARGMDPAAAARAARVSLGGGDRFREEVRDEWLGALAGFGQDVRLGVRRLRRQPGFAAVALVTLALGIGATTAIFSLVRGILLEPLPYGDPDRLVMFWNAAGDQRQDTWLSARELVEYRRATVSFDALAGYTHGPATLVEGEPERVRAAAVTANTFAVLGTPALQGRTFTADEDTPGSDGVVLLGHGVWQRHFGGARDVIGQVIRVNGEPRTVVGIMPPDFRLPLDYREDRPTELWVPAAIDPSQNLPWGNRSSAWALYRRMPTPERHPCGPAPTRPPRASGRAGPTRPARGRSLPPYGTRQASRPPWRVGTRLRRTVTAHPLDSAMAAIAARDVGSCVEAAAGGASIRSSGSCVREASRGPCSGA